MAKLYFRYGAMNSGKSTALMQVAHNYEERGMQVVIMKPTVDTKGGDKLVSRLGVTRTVDMAVTPEMDVLALMKDRLTKLPAPACILTDESQFFTPKQVDQLLRITVELNIPVIAYGLRTDFSLNGFPGSTRLLQLAHAIEEMKTICFCGRKATCNGRRVNGEYVFEGDQVVIDQGGEVEYVSLCAQCYLKAHDEFYKKHPKITI